MNATDTDLLPRLKSAYQAACKRSRKHRPTLHDCALSLGLSDGPFDNREPGDAERLILRLVSAGHITFEDNGKSLIPVFQ